MNGCTLSLYMYTVVANAGCSGNAREGPQLPYAGTNRGPASSHQYGLHVLPCPSWIRPRVVRQLSSTALPVPGIASLVAHWRLQHLPIILSFGYEVLNGLHLFVQSPRQPEQYRWRPAPGEDRGRVQSMRNTVEVRHMLRQGANQYFLRLLSSLEEHC